MNGLANEMRSYMEQTNQTLISQMEKSNQALLQALQNMGYSINNLKGHPTHARDTSSNHFENNNESSTTRIPKTPFLPRGEIPREEEGIEQPMTRTEDLARAYTTLEPHIREVVSFREFCEDNRQEAHWSHINKELKHKVNKVTLPNFDGLEKITAHAWLQKLNTFFTLSPMTEEDAIHFAILYLEEAVHEWWHHGLISLGHQAVNSYGEFCQRLVNRFDDNDSRWYFQELTQLKQTRTLEEFTCKFQRLSVMVPDLS